MIENHSKHVVDKGISIMVANAHFRKIAGLRLRLLRIHQSGRPDASDLTIKISPQPSGVWVVYEVIYEIVLCSCHDAKGSLIRNKSKGELIEQRQEL